ncbi:TetR/AcrR family transcriptional regulator C-terminal domain-containing protein [Streptomyces cellostaticus]|uniref:TetR/AcrR family transcriptional regulator C-terminal domain-containing protein n=1 Tax=Streptomyces cellostaticus TaxID=67285 RepID=UPI002025C520|nr:TetR/AcrR family transcriptional regulator C-terminal domain-containing protein [Streptomyces cellostaticus]
MFLNKGYPGTSRDEVAALAAVSKQTVYKNSADTQRLFTEIIHGGLDRIDELFSDVTGSPAGPQDLEKDLTARARQFVTILTQPRLLQLRRLVIAEADRFPELGRTYYERGPERVHALLAESFEQLAGRTLLAPGDPVLAANHLTWLITSIPVNKVMFCGSGEHFTRAELDHCADEAVRVFLAAYRRDTQSA